jgi:hypothetical protein
MPQSTGKLLLAEGGASYLLLVNGVALDTAKIGK